MLYKPSSVVHRLIGISNVKLNRSFVTSLFVFVHIGKNAQLFIFLLDFLYHLFNENSSRTVYVYTIFLQ